jgi:hypothetical protein
MLRKPVRFWPLNRHLNAALRALSIDERPLRDEYKRRAHWTVADLRERLVEPGDHLKLVWPVFEEYAAFVFAMARQSRGRDCLRLWTQRAENVVSRAFRFSAISDFEVVTFERERRIRAVEFRSIPNLGSSDTSSTRYRVELD